MLTRFNLDSIFLKVFACLLNPYMCTLFLTEPFQSKLHLLRLLFLKKFSIQLLRKAAFSHVTMTTPKKINTNSPKTCYPVHTQIYPVTPQNDFIAASPNAGANYILHVHLVMSPQFLLT